MVNVPLPVTCEAEASGIVMLFCCALAPTVDARTMEAPGRGASNPWPVRVNARLSTVRVPSESDEKMPPFCGAQRLCEELRSLTAGGLRGERELSSCIHGGVARTNPRAEERNVEWTAQGHCGPFCY